MTVKGIVDEWKMISGEEVKPKEKYEWNRVCVGCVKIIDIEEKYNVESENEVKREEERRNVEVGLKPRVEVLEKENEEE